MLQMGLVLIRVGLILKDSDTQTGDTTTDKLSQVRYPVLILPHLWGFFRPLLSHNTSRTARNNSCIRNNSRRLPKFIEVVGYMNS